MTPADLAKHSAISFEAKKDSLRQMQNGDWKVAFTVQAIDMDKRLTMALPGARYMAVLVEVGADELPVHQPKEVMPHPRSPRSHNAKPQPETPDKPQSAGAKREKMDWRELQPAAQCGIRCLDPVFWAFLREKLGWIQINTSEGAAEAVRDICCVQSRSELGTKHAARMLWKQLDDQFLAWQRVGA